MIFNYKILKDTKVSEYLKSFYLSKSKIYKLFTEDSILVNNEIINKDCCLSKNDTLSIILNENIDYIPEDKKIDILYEDDYLLIINKPKSIIIHNDSKDKLGSLCNVVANYYLKKNLDLNVRFAHRLDIDTTGIIIFCKDILSLAYMNHIIESHELNRYYYALVSNKINNKSGVINLPIGEDRHHKSRRRVSKTGQNAITYYKVLLENKDYSLVEVLLKTGRTHQIRVHFSHIGNPLLGDSLYGGSKKYIDRCALHSQRVEFIHPVYKTKISLKCELPLDMKRLIGDFSEEK